MGRKGRKAGRQEEREPNSEGGCMWRASVASIYAYTRQSQGLPGDATRKAKSKTPPGNDQPSPSSLAELRWEANRQPSEADFLKPSLHCLGAALPTTAIVGWVSKYFIVCWAQISRRFRGRTGGHWGCVRLSPC